MRVVPLRLFGRVRFSALRLIWAGVIGLVVALAWLGWTMVGAGRAVHAAAQKAIDVAELRGRIAYLDECLTMSARMASMSGDPRWFQRFEEAAPALDAAIAAAANMASPSARTTLGATMIEAHRDLLQMERRALTLAEGRQFDDARALLDGAEFSYLQDVYATGMEVFGEDLKGGADAQARVLNDRIWVQASGFGLGAILLVMAVMAAQQRIRLRAATCTDALTGLPNRRQFYGQLASVLGRECTGDERRRVLLLIGVDHFKLFNDAHGHARADRLLKLVAARLRAAAQPEWPLARVGGDEFALLIEAAPSEHPDGSMARGIVTALKGPYRLDNGVEVSLGFSGGALPISPECVDAGDAMRQAGIALRQAKADGRNCLRVFDQAMDARSQARARLEGDLRQAIERDDIVCFFQPLVDMRVGHVVGVEALARWHHAERGWVSPAEFIPLAEDLGLIGVLTERLLKRACQDALPWPAHVTVAFNVSPLQLRDDALPAQIRAILAETGFPACRLELEVTESALVQDLDLARSLLQDLRGSGIRLALDDFGTGYSSLKHLRSLPFDKLKIDASFVGGMVGDPESGKIVAAVVGLGHSLGLATVAEGVETVQVAELLRDLGCDLGQGWLYGRPVPAAELAALLADTPSPVLAA